MKNEPKNPAEMTAGELEEHLAMLQVELEDLEEERMFVLGQTGLHVSAGTVKKYESRKETLGERIAEVERLIQEKAD